MGNKKFLARLAKELPDWVARGWVQAGAERAILEHVAAQRGGTPWLTYAFSILGVLLFGSGIITYFAANWGEIPKLVKLAILFGSLWLAYGAAWHALRNQHAPLLGQALLLLGAILFGANIMLVAQIYHIDAHFPNGVLLWSLGALAGAYLVRSQPMLVAAIVLGWLWTTLEFEVFTNRHQAHWPFLILWAACLPLIYRHRFRAGLHLALVALLWWSFHAFGVDGLLWSSGSKIYLVQFYFLAYLALFLLGMLFATFGRLADFAHTVQRYGIFAALVCAYALTSPHVQSGQWGHMWGEQTVRAAAGSGYIAFTFAALALVAALALWHRHRAGGGARLAYLKWGQALIGALALLLLANLFLGGASGGWVAIAFNLLFFAGMLWLIYAGMHGDDRFLVNLAFVFFGLTLLTRYFDTFWTLLNRSYFFMVGGLLLIAGGYVLERKRRQITASIGARHEGGAA
ncbi:MAG TPA: DUF2157 domain-containing protein [Acidiferrobacterales bacterium]|nr:DUF2157 domain-containing protein [Acidiferrobacterales bacterium]